MSTDTVNVVTTARNHEQRAYLSSDYSIDLSPLPGGIEILGINIAEDGEDGPIEGVYVPDAGVGPLIAALQAYQAKQDQQEIALKRIEAAIPDLVELMKIIMNAFHPQNQRPEFDVPRFWSNPDLNDPRRIIAHVLTTPTAADLAVTIHAYGAQRVVDGLSDLMASNELAENRRDHTIHLLKIALEGVAEAAVQHSSTVQPAQG